jgi:hypothetical protein
MKFTTTLAAILLACMSYASTAESRLTGRSLTPLMFFVMDEAGFPLGDVEIRWNYTDHLGQQRSGTFQRRTHGHGLVNLKTTDTTRSYQQYEFNSPWGAGGINTHDGATVTFHFRKHGYRDERRTFTVPTRSDSSTGGAILVHMSVRMTELGTPIRIQR